MNVSVNPKILVEPRRKFEDDAELLALLQRHQQLTAQQLQAAQTAWSNAGSILRSPADSTHAHGSATSHFDHTGCLYFASDVEVPRHATQVSTASSISSVQVLSLYSGVSTICRLHIPAAIQSCTTASSLFKTIYRRILSTQWLGLMQTTTVATMNWMSKWSRIGLLSIHLTGHEVLPLTTRKRHHSSHYRPAMPVRELQPMDAVSAALCLLHVACAQSVLQLSDACRQLQLVSELLSTKHKRRLNQPPLQTLPVCWLMMIAC